MSGLLSRFVVLLGFFLVACNPASAPATTLQIGLSPAARPLQAAIGVCLPADEGLSANLQVIYPNQVDLAEWDLYFQLGEPASEPGFVAQVAWEQLALALPSERLLHLSAVQVAQLFRGQIANWSELGQTSAEVNLYLPPAGDETRQAFERAILQGQVAGDARLTTSPAEMAAAVAADANAVGLLPLAWASPGISLASLDLRLPVLTLADAPPQGAAHALLACLQGPLGQAALTELYEGIQ
ncbi:MAG: hypothetical protein KIT46_07695 [Anaerolineales bacterium]|nr:hypothetical protein [Anaerolineales bacterium]MCW5855913.1 hypothetical protein [Anaerolineales bacterium]